MPYHTPLQNRISNQRGLINGIVDLMAWDSTIFDLLVLPDGVDRDLTVATILERVGKTPLEHPDPNYMRYYINVWSMRRKVIWQKLLESTQFDYNPIHHYDRNEEITDTREETVDRTQNRTTTGTVTDTGSTNVTGDVTGNVTSKHDVSAENATDYQADTKDTEDTTSHNAQETAVQAQSDTQTGEDTTGKDTRSESYKHTAYMYGNIGVTTTQQMIEAEREVVQFSVIEFIADDFKNEFCLSVY